MSERCPGRSNEYRRDASGGSSLSFVGAGILYTSTEFVDNATMILEEVVRILIKFNCYQTYMCPPFRFIFL